MHGDHIRVIKLQTLDHAVLDDASWHTQQPCWFGNDNHMIIGVQDVNGFMAGRRYVMGVVHHKSFYFAYSQASLTPGIHMTGNDDELFHAIMDVTPKLLVTMDAFEQVQRNMHPSNIDQLADFIRPFEAQLLASNETFAPLEFPEHIAAFGDRLGQAIDYTLRACNGLTNAGNDTFATMKAMRAICRAQEFVYPLANVFTPINQYFLEAPARENAALLESLNQDRAGQRVGILNAENDRGNRGGFSLYIPEYIDKQQPRSLVIALHGGTGHGADMLWSWLREARTRGFILLSPTSQGDTWSLMEEDIDLPALLQMLDFVKSECEIDPDHVLLTGMSDGATYALLAGLKADSPFTHLAPFSGVLHPEIPMMGNMQYAQGKPIYLVHGSLDWMFPIEVAHMANAELTQAGADVTFRPIEGLSHTYCRSEFPQLIEWFNNELVVPT